LIQGIKAYPAGVTTNSAAGVTDFSAFYRVFSAMQANGLILNIHGETPGVSVLDAEAAFLPTLEEIHSRFPKLRIVLEHVSSRAALEVVQKLGNNVRCTITAHHLHITADDWKGIQSNEGQSETRTGKAHNWCKPAAKTEDDRIALIQAIVGTDKVMFGSDSAPHPATAKETSPPAAGCFTQGWTASLVLLALEDGVSRGWIQKEAVTREVVEGFLCGRAQNWLEAHWKAGDKKWIRLSRRGEKIPQMVRAEKDGEIVEVVPFGAGRECWSVDFLEGEQESAGDTDLQWEVGSDSSIAENRG
jgi:dihydroorotase